MPSAAAATGASDAAVTPAPAGAGRAAGDASVPAAAAATGASNAAVTPAAATSRPGMRGRLPGGPGGGSNSSSFSSRSGLKLFGRDQDLQGRPLQGSICLAKAKAKDKGSAVLRCLLARCPAQLLPSTYSYWYSTHRVLQGKNSGVQI